MFFRSRVRKRWGQNASVLLIRVRNPKSSYGQNQRPSIILQVTIGKIDTLAVILSLFPGRARILFLNARQSFSEPLVTVGQIDTLAVVLLLFPIPAGTGGNFFKFPGTSREL